MTSSLMAVYYLIMDPLGPVEMSYEYFNILVMILVIEIRTSFMVCNKHTQIITFYNVNNLK